MRLLITIVLVSFLSTQLTAQTFGPQQPIGISEAGIIDVKPLDVDEDGDRDFVTISNLTRIIAWQETIEGSVYFTKHIIHKGLEDITQMELADMDRDGDIDIIIAHGGTNYGRVVWLSNEGNGNFAEPEEYLNSYPIFEMKVMDIDYDNDVDIIIAQEAPSTFGIEAIVWYPNDEFGNIGSSSTLLLSSGHVHTFDIGQLNDDLHWDIVFVQHNTNDVIVLNGTGIGTFGGTTFVVSPSQVVDQVLAHNIEYISNTDEIIIFRPSIFRVDKIVFTGSSYVIDDWYYFNSAVRLQKNGFTDFYLESIAAFDPITTTLTILSSQGGQWYLGENVWVENWIAYVTDVIVLYEPLGDLMQIVTLNQNSNSFGHSVSYEPGVFYGSFTISSSDTFQPSYMYLGPIFGASPDVQLSVSRQDEYSFGNRYSFYDTPAILDPLNNEESYIGVTDSKRLIAGDIDQDGDLDCVYIQYFSDELYVAFNQGGTYSVLQAGQPTITQVKDFDLADINGDGDLDLVVSSNDGPNGLRIFTMQYIGSEQFGGQISVDNLPLNRSATQLEDMDGDGDKDIVVLANSPAQVLPVWHENNGAGLFLTQHDIPNPSFHFLTVGHIVDMDADGDLDILGIYALGLSTHNYWMENDGEGSFTSNGSPQTHFISSANFAKDIHGEDIDNDGDTDVILGIDQSIWLLERTGAETYLTSTITNLVNNVRDIGTADIDGDGDMDLFSVSSDDDLVAWYENLTNNAAPCPEDINGDGTVNIDDFIALNSAYGSSCGSCPEDINGDGLVNIDDFIALNSAYGSDCSSFFTPVENTANPTLSTALSHDLRNSAQVNLHPALAKQISDMDDKPLISLYPVPNDGQGIVITMGGGALQSKEPLLCSVFDVSGKLVCSKQLRVSSGKSLEFMFDTPLESGVYLLRVLLGDEYVMEQFVVE